MDENKVIMNRDILSAIGSTSAGASEVLDMTDGVNRFSCHIVYDVQAPSAAAIASATDIWISSDVDHPSQFHKAAHGFVTGFKVQIATSTTLPSPFVAVTDYFVIKVDANYFKLATSLANALAGTAIAITDVGVGTQTITGVALASVSATFQKSNDNVNWIDIQAATSITADGSVMLEVPNASYRFFRVSKALTSGICDLKAYVLALG